MINLVKKITAADFSEKKLIGYRNINEIFPQNDRLHSCETLFGDYDAELLIVLQDAADYKTILNLYQKTGKNPFVHNPKIETNKNLFNALKPFFQVGETVAHPNNRTCGVYYANAVWLLKESTGLQGLISNKKQACDIEIIEATLNNLPKLKLVIACGQAAYASISSLIHNDSETLVEKWEDFRNQAPVLVQIGNREFLFASTFHPGKRGVHARAKLPNHENMTGQSLFKNDFQQILELAGFERIEIRKTE